MKKIPSNESSSQPSCGGHLVGFFQNSVDLAHDAADFVTPALQGEDAVILGTARQNVKLIQRTLAQRGFPVQALENSGRLQYVAAEGSLDKIVVNGEVSWERYDAVIGTGIRLLMEKYQKVWIFGETAGLLQQKGQAKAALDFEIFGNRLMQMYPVEIFCAYSVDIFDPGQYRQTIPAICGTHSHAFACSREGLLQQVLQQAYEEVTEPGLPSLKSIFQEEAGLPERHLTPSLNMLLWLNSQVQPVARQVLSRARVLYEAATPSH